MTKQELVNSVAEQTGLNSYQVKEVLERTFDVIRDEVTGGDTVLFADSVLSKRSNARRNQPGT